MGGEQENVCATWMQQCGLRQRGASTRNMSWGGMKTRIPYPGNPSALKTKYSFCFNILLVIHGYTTLYYVDGQQVESAGTSPWCIIYDGHHGPSALKTH